MASTSLQKQAQALGNPTRHAIFHHIAQAGPVGVADLNEEFPFNHNAIRQHLAKLVTAGLVIEAQAQSTGRGRPRLIYEVNPAAQGQWATPGPYERLSHLLIEIIRTGLDPVDVGRHAADQFRTPTPSGDVVVDVNAAMARQGFEPEVRARRDETEIVLHRCPFASAALADRATVCALHLGIAEGLTDATPATVTELVASDPRKADCLLRIQLTGKHDNTSTGGRLSLRGKAGER